MSLTYAGYSGRDGAIELGGWCAPLGYTGGMGRTEAGACDGSVVGRVAGSRGHVVVQLHTEGSFA